MSDSDSGDFQKPKVFRMKRMAKPKRVSKKGILFQRKKEINVERDSMNYSCPLCGLDLSNENMSARIEHVRVCARTYKQMGETREKEDPQELDFQLEEDMMVRPNPKKKVKIESIKRDTGVTSSDVEKLNIPDTPAESIINENPTTPTGPGRKQRQKNTPSVLACNPYFFHNTPFKRGNKLYQPKRFWEYARIPDPLMDKASFLFPETQIANSDEEMQERDQDRTSLGSLGNLGDELVFISDKSLESVAAGNSVVEEEMRAIMGKKYSLNKVLPQEIRAHAGGGSMANSVTAGDLQLEDKIIDEAWKREILGIMKQCDDAVLNVMYCHRNMVKMLKEQRDILLKSDRYCNYSSYFLKYGNMNHNHRKVGNEED